MTRINIGLMTPTTSTGAAARDARTTLPLPVLSIVLVYQVTPELSWRFKSKFFALQFDKWDENYIDTTLGIEYRIFENIGLGISLAGNSLKVAGDTSDYRFVYENRMVGIMANAVVYF